MSDPVPLPELFVSDRDDEILGVANSIDGMGVLPVWSTRGRDLVPHLTAQTTSARGFQVLLEALRLVERFADDEPDVTDRVADVFILIEQAIARIVGQQTGDWSLPGSRRVRGRVGQPIRISLEDPSWHLLGSQRGNGLWGLYRGAAFRAGLLDTSLERLTDEAMTTVEAAPMIATSEAQDELFGVIRSALDGVSPELDTTTARPLVNQVMAAWGAIPAAELLWDRLIATTPLTATLASVILQASDDRIDHRTVLARTGQLFEEHAAVIDNVVRCENYLSVLESIFLFTCAWGGTRQSFSEAAAELGVDLQQLSVAQERFATSGQYEGIARARVGAFADRIDTSSGEGLLRSVLEVHEWVAKGRGRAMWVWEDEGGRLVGDVDVRSPSEDQFVVGRAWRNDYFLSALGSVAQELDGVRS